MKAFLGWVSLAGRRDATAPCVGRRSPSTQVIWGTLSSLPVAGQGMPERGRGDRSETEPNQPTAQRKNHERDSPRLSGHGRIFHHGLDTVFPEDNDPLHGAAGVADGVEHVLRDRRGEKQ